MIRPHDRVLGAIARLACHRYRLVLAVAALLTFLSLLPPILIGMRFAFDISQMLPQDIPAAQAFTRAVVDFDAVDDAVVVFRLRKGLEQVPTVGRVADRIAQKLREHPDIQDAYARKYGPEEMEYLLEQALPQYGLLLLDEERLERVDELLEPARIRTNVRRAKRRLFDAPTPESQRLVAHNVLGIMDVFKEALGGSVKGLPKEGENSYLVAELDEEMQAQVAGSPKAMLLLIAQPTQPAQSAKFATDIMELIQRVTEETVAEMLPPAALQDIGIEYGGGYEIARRYTARVNETLFSTLVVSLVGVVALFGWCFRRPGVLLYIGVPLVMVVSWTIGLGWIIFGQLNIVSCAFAAVLVGLGVDYAVHIYNRYAEERKNGLPVEEAFEVSLTQTGWAVFIGMVTTCLAFFALLATRFTQLSQFGVLAGLGIALSVPGMLFVLPALITARNRMKTEHPRVARPSRFFLPQIATAVEKHRIGVLVVGLLVAVLALARLALTDGALAFDERISSLRPRERAFELGGEIARVFSNRNPNKLMLLATGTTEREAVQRAAELADGCKELVREGLLLDYESVMRFLPSPIEQQERLSRLRTMDLEAALVALRQNLEREGLSEEPFYLTLRLLEQHIALLQKEPAEAILLPSDFFGTPIGKWMRRLVTRQRRVLDLRDPIPDDVQFPVTLAKAATDRNDLLRVPAGMQLTREELLALGPDAPDVLRPAPVPEGEPDEFTWVKRVTILSPGWTVKSNIFPPIQEESRTADLRLNAEWLATVRERLGLREQDRSGDNGGAYLTGTSLLAHELAGVVKQDFWRVSWAVLGVATAVLVFFYHRHPARVVYSLLPVGLGLVYLFGIMSLFQVEFNFINVLAVPIIIGLGVDNGIHLVNRFYEAGRHLRPMIEDTGRAIVVTTATSMVGFGSLAVGGYEGITSMGRLSILALLSNLVAALIVTPAILRTISPPEEAPTDPEADLD